MASNTKTNGKRCVASYGHNKYHTCPEWEIGSEGHNQCIEDASQKSIAMIQRHPQNWNTEERENMMENLQQFKDNSQREV